VHDAQPRQPGPRDGVTVAGARGSTSTRRSPCQRASPYVPLRLVAVAVAVAATAEEMGPGERTLFL